MGHLAFSNLLLGDICFSTHTHIYCAERIDEHSDSLMLYGSIFPDVAMAGIVSWNISRDMSKLCQLLNGTKLSPFAKGIMLHEEPHGIDRLVHGEEGYAYAEGAKLIPAVKQFFRADKDHSFIAHSFIEFAIEVLLYEKEKQLRRSMKSALTSGTRNAPAISEALSQCYGTSVFKSRIGIFLFNALTSFEYCADRLAHYWCAGYAATQHGAFLKPKDARTLLEDAKDIVQPTYEQFLEKVIADCKDKTKS